MGAGSRFFGGAGSGGAPLLARAADELGAVGGARGGDYAAQLDALERAISHLERAAGAAGGVGDGAAPLARRALAHAERVHVNASCRHAARVAAGHAALGEARARATRARARARAACAALGACEADEGATAAAGADASDAGSDAADGAGGVERVACGGAHDGDALLAPCPVLAATGDHRHMCAQLCYYRHYEPARRLEALRRAAAAAGVADATASLASWRVELRERQQRRGAQHVPWEVIFVDGNAKEYRTEGAALRALGAEVQPRRGARVPREPPIADAAADSDGEGKGGRAGRRSDDGCSDAGAQRTPKRRRRASVVASPGQSRFFATAPAPPLTPEDGMASPDAAGEAQHTATGTPRRLLDQLEGALLSCATMASRASGGSPRGLARVPGWLAPHSPYGLLEELYRREPWKLLVSCMLLNCTTRLQVDRVLPALFNRYPTARALAAAPDAAELERLLAPLGLQRRRSKSLLRFSREYTEKPWADVMELHGVGKYAADAYAIFILGRWRETRPDDHALNFYHRFLESALGDGSEAAA